MKNNRYIILGIMLLMVLSLIKINLYGGSSQASLENKAKFYGYSNFCEEDINSNKILVKDYEMKFWSIN